MNKPKILSALCGVILFCGMSFSLNAQTPLKVCPNPNAPCKSKHREFYPYDLSFVLPAKVKNNTPYKSEVFFAIILKSTIKLSENEECDGGEFSTKVENERKQAQKLFPHNKVFASHQCPDMGALSYEINGQPLNENFIAVYGGTNMLEADTILADAKAKYPKAVVKKMRVIFENIVQ
ncbi:MAG: hypothetical protein AB1757_28480 [Acidobacteriota bacterium]